MVDGSATLPECEIPALPLTDDPAGRVSWKNRIITLFAIFMPFVGVVLAAFFFWGWGFHTSDLVLFLTMYLLTGLGITVGFHRLFVHRSFETYTWVKFIWAVLGSMALQGSLIEWVANHRRHHQFSDTPHDPHSPHHRGEGFFGFVRGFWHSHIGWFFAPNPPGLERYVKDINSSPTLRLADKLMPLWVALGLLLPAVVGGLLTESWVGFWTGLIWGGLVRIFLVHHLTWSINSACHLWGSRPFRSNDESRNNFVFGIFGLGEGWHNAHHAFPTSARHGLRWWEFDLSYLVIRLQAMLGLAWNVKVPAREAVDKQRRKSG